MEALDTFSGKLDQLLKRFAALDADNKRLRATIEGQNKVIQRLNQKVRDMEADLAGHRLAQHGLAGEDKEDMKKQLDAVIGEIDKILAGLNE
ncbi:MAG: hypothetical protein EBZ77_06565 [Chitinophagia bacterium]|nr:hypothetical protein [Chitinophagia bacterium]